MASFNKVLILGNLTRDPQVRYIPSGSAVTELGLAINRTWFDKNANQRKEEVTFVDVTVWGKTAETAGQYLHKGNQVLIEGRLTLEQWDDKETGQKRSKLKVVCETMTMLGGGQKQEGDQTRGQSSAGEGSQDLEPPDGNSLFPQASPSDDVPF